MGIHTGIEWCDSTLNPMMGCDGCELWTPDGRKRTCYAGVQIERYQGSSPNFPKVFTEPQLYTHRFDELSKWPDLTGKEREDKPWLNGLPRLVFLCDMGDPFTESLPLFWLAPYLPFLGSLPHIIILLTKRTGRMKQFSEHFPFPENFWLLASVTGNGTFGRLWPLGRVVGGGLRGISYEPALDLLELRGLLGQIGWVIAGGESGVGCVAPKHEWFARVRNDCDEQRVPFFFKQWGGVRSKSGGRLLDGREYLQMPRVEARASA